MLNIEYSKLCNEHDVNTVSQLQKRKKKNRNKRSKACNFRLPSARYELRAFFEQSTKYYHTIASNPILYWFCKYFSVDMFCYKLIPFIFCTLCRYWKTTVGKTRIQLKSRTKKAASHRKKTTAKIQFTAIAAVLIATVHPKKVPAITQTQWPLYSSSTQWNICEVLTNWPHSRLTYLLAEWLQ